jgi:Immunoglobulin I-set domain
MKTIHKYFMKLLLMLSTLTLAQSIYGATDGYGNPTNSIDRVYFRMDYGPKGNWATTIQEGDSLDWELWAQISAYGRRVGFGPCNTILNYTIYKGSKIILSGQYPYWVPSGPKINISGLARIEDAGEYRCEYSGTLPDWADLPYLESTGKTASGNVKASTGIWTVKVVPRQIFVSPNSCAAYQNTEVIFTASDGNLTNPQYQWKKNGVVIPGATSNKWVIPSAKPVDAGSYSVTVSSPKGSWSSAPSPLTVNPPRIYAPVILTQPVSAKVEVGEKASMSVRVSDENSVNYQWMKNGVKIDGAIQNTFVLDAAKITDKGTYSVIITNPVGSVTSSESTLEVGTLPTVSIPLPTPGVINLDFTVLQKGFSVYPASLTPIDYSNRPRSYDTAGCVIGANTGGPSYFVVKLKAAIHSKTPYTVGWLRDGVSPGSLRKNGYYIAPSDYPYLVKDNGMGDPVANRGINNYGSLSTWLGGYYCKDHTYPDYSFGFPNCNTEGLMDVVFSDDVGSVYTCVVSNSAGTAIASVKIDGRVAKPTITQQPVSLALTAGAKAAFTVEASGDGVIAYQWFKGGVKIDGATSKSYTIAATQSSDAGNYTVSVTNSGGSVTSSAAAMSVSVAKPTITQQPVSLALTSGSKAAFTVEASGDGVIAYQWFKGGVKIDGATSKLYTIAATQSSDAGNYTVSVTNAGGSVTSSAAAMSVSVAKPTITQQPVSLALTAGAKAAFTVEASGDGVIAYQWFKGGVKIDGATSKSYTIVAARVSDQGDYTVTVGNAYSSENVVSSQASLKISPNSVPQGKTVYISPSGNDASGTGAADTPFLNIQKGLDCAGNGDTVCVLAGSYSIAPLNFRSKAVNLVSKEGPYKTFVNCGRNMIATIEKPANGGALIKGFTFFNAYRNNSSDWGAATLLDLKDTSTKVENCVFRSNTAEGSYSAGTSSAFLIYANGGQSTVSNCLIYNNGLKSGDNNAVAAVFGGHFQSIENCTVANNTIDAIVTNYFFFIAKSLLRVYCTDSLTKVSNCISWGNQISVIGARNERYPRKTPPETPSSTYSVCETLVPGTGNLSLDPLFKKVSVGDYSLQTNSPCTNSGDPASANNPDGTRANMGFRQSNL